MTALQSPAALTRQLLAVNLPISGVAPLPSGTVPDPSRLTAADSTGTVWRVDFGTSPTSDQATQALAVVAAFNGSAATLAADLLTLDRATALALASDPVPPSKLVRAILLTLLDEINLLRTSLSLPPRTTAQAKSAVRDKLNSGQAD